MPYQPSQQQQQQQQQQRSSAGGPGPVPSGGAGVNPGAAAGPGLVQHAHGQQHQQHQPQHQQAQHPYPQQQQVQHHPQGPYQGPPGHQQPPPPQQQQPQYPQPHPHAHAQQPPPGHPGSHPGAHPGGHPGHAPHAPHAPQFVSGPPVTHLHSQQQQQQQQQQQPPPPMHPQQQVQMQMQQTHPVPPHAPPVASHSGHAPPPPHPHHGPPMQQQQQQAPAPPPPSQAQQQQQQQPPADAGAHRPLNVKDALSYLDQVKIQFGDQPEVYNRFLDIMKDFKSQAIDTPGVIERVSSLFRGHPQLITGFNTFLPPGYRIEPTNNPSDPVRVTTPRDQPSYHHPPMHPQGHPHQEPAGYYPPGPPPPSGYAPSAGPGGSTLPPLSTITSGGPPGAQPPLQPGMAYGASMPGAPNIVAGMGGPQGPGGMPPREGHPMPGQPGPQRGIPASGIAPQMQQQQQPMMAAPHSGAAQAQAQAPPGQAADAASRARGPVEFNHAINYVNKIKNRFSSEPDTYKQFLEILQTYQREQKPIQEVYAQVQVLFMGAPDLLDEFKQFLPDNNPQPAQPAQQPLQAPALGQQLPQQQAQQASALPSSSVAAANAAKAAAGAGKKQAKRPTATAAPANYTMTYAGPPSQGPPPKKKPRTGAASSTSAAAAAASAGLPPTVSGTASPGPSSGVQIAPPSFKGDKPSNLEEIEFFDKCKRVIGNKASYNEFLKILNLFSQEIIEAKTLIERVEPFLSRSPDLFDWFKRFVKYEEDEIVFNIPAERPEIDLQSCRRSGHSYRRLPKDVPRATCSGRDELIKEVLNDDWISHPVYVSETGFVAHKKTNFEEAVYKCEEERYEFDLNIEANLHVIALLEPIAKQIQSMSPDDRSKFRLPPGLGGYSSAIYQRVIKKIYDKERGAEIIEALHQSPAVAVPVVLKRLKQKDEEWKRSQREWNKVWREIDAKNFAKALDHQGIHFKITDRKAINIKSIVTEIEVLQREQREKRSNLANRYQFDFAFKKLDVFSHVRRLIISFMGDNLSKEDLTSIRDFLKIFVKKFFLIEDLAGYDDDYDVWLPPPDDDGQSQNGSVSPRRNGGSNGGMGNGSGAMDVDMPEAPFSDKGSDVNGRRRTSYTFYANSAVYVFFRLYQMLFSRLLKMKEMSDELDGVPTRPEMFNPAALELGLQKESGASYTEKDRYTELLKIINLFVTGELEANEFEDRARTMFWTSGYLVFTIDRLLQALVKQMQFIVSDNKSIDLINLFYREREKPLSSSRQEAMYRYAAEELIQDENLYRLEFYIPERVLTIQLLGKDEHMLDDSISSEEKWSLYVDQFVQLSSHEGMHYQQKEPFLRRNLPTEVPEEPPLNVETRSGLELKICVNTYKIFFVDNTEDYFRRRRSGMLGSLVGLTAGERKQAESTGRSRRHAKFEQWLDGPSGWRKELTADDAANRDKAFDGWVKDGHKDSRHESVLTGFGPRVAPTIASALPSTTAAGSAPDSTSAADKPLPAASAPAVATSAAGSAPTVTVSTAVAPAPVKKLVSPTGPTIRVTGPQPPPSATGASPTGSATAAAGSAGPAGSTPVSTKPASATAATATSATATATVAAATAVKPGSAEAMNVDISHDDFNALIDTM
ncbi:hypothetical protein BC831DRAFT_412149 [Entophlyctis helioformis]|nr:hypothetical protein BC831DRAFT_412149 [Entophlyctis helioformis]